MVFSVEGINQPKLPVDTYRSSTCGCVSRAFGFSAPDGERQKEANWGGEPPY